MKQIMEINLKENKAKLRNKLNVILLKDISFSLYLIKGFNLILRAGIQS